MSKARASGVSIPREIDKPIEPRNFGYLIRKRTGARRNRVSGRGPSNIFRAGDWSKDVT